MVQPYTITPLRHYAITPLSHYAIRPLRHDALLGEARNIRFYAILSEIPGNHPRNLQYLLPAALKTQHEMNVFFGNPSKHTIK